MSTTVNSQQQSEDHQILDDASTDESFTPQVPYDITSFGADYDVEGLVKRLNRGDILIPPFQRNYVWNIQDASRFIESLLLGLPVPAVFLARESDTNKLLVIDGQQRLKTLQFFYDGIFNPKEDAEKQQVFRLVKVQPQFEGCAYKTLEERDRIKLDDSLIHAIIIKQESPEDDNTSIYHIFDRLNSRGRVLNPQEIRTALDHGPFIDLLKRLNEYESWRKVYGTRSSRLKDQELILRFFALYFPDEAYEKPMQEFLNKFSRKRHDADSTFLYEVEKLFTKTIDVVWTSLGKQAFRPKGAFNAAVYDSIMVGLARRLNKDPEVDFVKVKKAYDDLIGNDEYSKLISQSTADEANVIARLKMASETFDSI